MPDPPAAVQPSFLSRNWKRYRDLAKNNVLAWHLSSADTTVKYILIEAASGASIGGWLRPYLAECIAFFGWALKYTGLFLKAVLYVIVGLFTSSN